MARPPEYEGLKLTVECMQRRSGSCPAGTFLDALSGRDRTKLDVIFQRLGDMGSLKNRTKFKKVDDGVFEIKSGQIRLFCFFTNDKRLVLLYGIRKKTDRLKTKDIRKAINMRAEFLDDRREMN